MRTFASAGAWTVVSLVVLSTACLLPVTDRVDGASCADDDECKSHRCNEGYCGGSSCKPNDASTCDGGWKCIHSDPDPISGFFGADGSDTCRPTCGHCPGNMYCEKGGTDGTTLCSFGKAPLELGVQLPQAITGRPARIVAVATPPAGRLVKCEWSTGDGKPAEETAGPELTHVYDFGPQVTSQQQFPLRVSCQDDGGRRGSVEASVEVGCQPKEGACTPSVCCADPGFHCLPATGGSGNVCRAPVAPQLTITGAATIPVYQSTDFTASTSGGEGQILSVTWKFSDSSFDRNGITVSRSFSDVGTATVRAQARTSLGQDIEQVHTLTVCQVENGRCGSAEPCCAPLACKPSGSTMRCLP